MSLGKNLSVETLGRINILQSMVTLLPNQTTIMRFICQGLKDIEGVKSLKYRLLNKGDLPVAIDSSSSADRFRFFPVKYKTITYAEFIFEIAEPEFFEPYVPFLQNFNNMVAVIFEERAQRKLNQTLMGELEQRIAKRTSELQEKEEDLRITLQSIGDAVISTDIHGIVKSMNPVAERLTGWKFADAIGKNLTDIFHIVNTHTLQTAFNPVQRVLATGKIVGLANHTSLIARDGTQHQIADSASPILDIKGNIRGVVLIFRDVTEEYRVAEALKASEEKYREIVEETGDLVARTDQNGVFTYVNRTAEKIFGITPLECLGKSAFDFIHPEDREKTREWFEACIKNQIRQSSFENRQVHQGTKETFQFLWTSNFLYDDTGKVFSVNNVAHDITEQRRAEQEKSKLEARLEHAQKMESIGQLAGGVAHDFNNMLAVILGHTELAMDELDPTQPLFSDLEEIRKAAERSAEITRQLLTFARKQAVIPRAIDLNETVEVMLKMLRRLIGEEIDLSWLPRTGTCLLKIDPVQIDQILANLCVNARDAIGGVGKITIETGQTTFDEEYCSRHGGFVPGKYVMLAVSDNGSGMDEETVTHIFEPFFTTKEIGEGTGLGLATVYGIVSQNNGFINVHSEPGRGTTFTIYFPLLTDVLDQTSNNLEHSIIGGTETILLVEDELMIRDMTSRMLARMGYTVLSADTPANAIDLIGGHDAGHIDLLLTDVIMPGMNGCNLAEQLLEKQPGLTCLFMSGYTANVISKQGVFGEGVHFIQKPFSINQLATKIRAALDYANEKLH